MQKYIDRDNLIDDWGVEEKIPMDHIVEGPYFNPDGYRGTLTYEDQAKWRALFNKGYKDELVKALGIKVPKYQQLSVYMENQLKDPDRSQLVRKIVNWHRVHEKEQ